jgi:cytochrome c556
MTFKPNKLIATLSVTAIISLGTIGAFTVANAHGGATGVVKERMMLMEDIGKAMKQISAMFKGKATYNGPEVARLSAVIKERGSDHLTKLFPAGSLDAPTEALPAIWDQWDRFGVMARQLTDAAKGLENAATAERPQAMQAFAALAKTCSTCHTDFRKKKE